jgi:hypothetical protein
MSSMRAGMSRGKARLTRIGRVPDISCPVLAGMFGETGNG